MSSAIDSTTTNQQDAATRITVSPTAASAGGFFGADGPSFTDLLDTINPLHHIPIVSSIYERMTGDTESVAAKLAGGALFGGPIGFIASLADSIFQQATGKGVGDTMIAALTGDDASATTQVARASSSSTSTASVASTTVTPSDTDVARQAALSMASATPIPAATDTSDDAQKKATRDRAVLDLYGANTTSAHRSYQKAQLVPYLKDVNSSQVL